jgi:uncharacterized protein (DUF488 family)
MTTMNKMPTMSAVETRPYPPPRWAPPQVVTIGVYGFDEACFFERLCEAQVDLFVDIRRRRALRGARYAFANSRRLQARLEAIGIRYEHRLDLAPSKFTRQIQDIHDRINKRTKRERTCLAPAFVEAYRRECLTNFDIDAFLAELGLTVKTVAFFCVECEPQACHRSLVAEQFAAAGVSVVHLVP